MNRDQLQNMSCPVPVSDYSKVTMAHGGGGRLTNNLIDKMMMKAFSNPVLEARHDGAILNVRNGRLAYSTDSHVITPLFFPGGDIGALSIYGTVNDLAMCGGAARWISAGFILEEGLSMETLWKVVRSMAVAAADAGVLIVTGDTKVVERGKGDGIYINTSGVGVIPHGVEVTPTRVRAGDSVVLSGDIGRHGMAIMAVREGIGLKNTLESDLAPLSGPVSDLLAEGLDVHCMRDLTRGGLASALNEIASMTDCTVRISENSIPVREEVMGACEILGFDPLYVANEGKFVLFLPSNQAGRAVEIMRRHPICRDASVIGSVEKTSEADVVMTSAIGSERIVDMISGEQLPRIC